MNRKVIIIAEAGVNHNGSMEIAIKLIDVAKEANVDYVKFQTFIAENVISKNAVKADYQKTTTGSNESQLEMVKKLQLSESQHEEIIDYCNKKEIQFFSTAFDLESLDYLAKLGLTMVKIPSGEITNLPYLRKASLLFKKIILSTGMATMQEIKTTLQLFLDAGIAKEHITILHCNTEYPTPMEDVNLNAMIAIKKEFDVEIGYSDHTLGIEVPIAAVALGANIIEKHFTLDKKMEGPDHAASLEPSELIAMVKAIRNIEKAMQGNGLKVPSKSELKNITIARKSIIAKMKIKIGDVFNENNITTKRPGNGISAMEWDNVIGKIATNNFEEDELISL